MLDATLTEDEHARTEPVERTRRLRNQTEQLIAMLREAKAQVEQRLDADAREDHFANVRGASSFDLAIREAEHTRDLLDRAFEHDDS